MNKYQCETCKKFPCRELLESSETMSDSVLSIAMKGLYMTFISKVGCSSHSEFKSERDEVLSEWATCIHHCAHIGCLSRYNEIVAGYRDGGEL